MFAAMGAILVSALAVPHAFNTAGLWFAGAITAARVAQIGLMLLASRGEEQSELRHSTIYGLGISTTIAAVLLVIASQTDGAVQGSLWALALVLDIAGPFLVGVEGWQL